MSKLENKKCNKCDKRQLHSNGNCLVCVSKELICEETKKPTTMEDCSDKYRLKKLEERVAKLEKDK